MARIETPKDIDALIKDTSLEFLIKLIKKNNYDVRLCESESVDKKNDMYNLAEATELKTYDICPTGILQTIIKIYIKVDFIIYKGNINPLDSLNRGDYNINRLYLSNGTFGVSLNTKNPVKIHNSIKEIIESISCSKADYIGVPAHKVEIDFETYAKYRKSMFNRTLRMLRAGYKIPGLYFEVVCREVETCPICTEYQYIFIKTKCCKGVSCYNCFLQYGLEELENRKTIRCIFHRTDDGQGFSAVPDKRRV